jgi:hypothetical protein
MQPEGSLLLSQKPAAGLCPEADEFSAYLSAIIFL